MDYIKELRPLVGSRPLILVGAAAIIVDEHGKVLLMRRTDNGAWGLPGGLMDLGETLEETVRREVREEVGFDMGYPQFWHLFSGPELYYQYPNGDEVFNVTAVYIAHKTIGELRVDQAEGSEAAYFDLADLPNRISPPIRPILAAFSRAGR